MSCDHILNSGRLLFVAKTIRVCRGGTVLRLHLSARSGVRHQDVLGRKKGLERAAISHADRFANFVRSLSRHSPYAASMSCVRSRASSHRPTAILSAHGSLLRANSHPVLKARSAQTDYALKRPAMRAVRFTLSLPFFRQVHLRLRTIPSRERCSPRP